MIAAGRSVESYVPVWLAAPVGIIVILTALAAAARKPPLRWVGTWLGWVFRRLIGDPIATFANRHFREQVIPLIRDEVQPLRDGQERIAADQAHLHDCIEAIKQSTDSAAEAAAEAVKEAVAASHTAIDEVRGLRTDAAGFREDLTAQAAIIAERGLILESVAPLIEQGQALLRRIEANPTLL